MYFYNLCRVRVGCNNISFLKAFNGLLKVISIQKFQCFQKMKTLQCYQIADFSIIGLFSIAPCKVIAPNLLCLFFVVGLCFSSWLPYLHLSLFYYRDSDSYCSFSPRVAIAKSFLLLIFAIIKGLQNEGLAKFNGVKLIFE